MVQFRSFEETLVLIGVLATAGIAYKILRTTALTCALLSAFSAVVIAYLTFSEFTLQDDIITYRNRFRHASFLLTQVRSVGMRTFWGGLPGHTFMFVMRRPPAQMDGFFARTGLFSWPSASKWVEAANLAIEAKGNN